MIAMSQLHNRLKIICNSGSSICISVQSWKDLERLWTLLENLVKNLDLQITILFNV